MNTNNDLPKLVIDLEVSNFALSEDKTTFHSHERIEYPCPNKYCAKPIGFVNFKMKDGKEDKCPKCGEKFTYQFNFLTP